MGSRFWYRSVSVVLACMVLVLGGTPLARAEKVNLPAAELRRIATHVVAGKILSIRQKVEIEGEYQYVRYVAQVKIRTVEKGTGLHPGEVCDVRYWHRTWLLQSDSSKGKGGGRTVNLGTAGHRGLPKTGDAMRIYLARNAYDGFTFNNKDGGFNVIGANGFQKL